ncbi:MAG TPA: baseplate J/gp47 family protein, partial [Bacteroidia bacterium]|nr:baseplate J/gp47 family protein [Bacteroidia bacterium]
GSGFLHDIYPVALARQALSQVKDKLPLKPYTPVIKTFSATYESDQHLNDENDQFYYLEPFGEQLLDEFPDDNTDPTIPLLSQFVARTHDLKNNKVVDDMRQTAMLFIGVENLVPQESLALLIQVVEDSGNHNALPPEISWSYLKKNKWINLTPQQVISDTSNGFRTSGIVELNIPEDATNDNTVLPTGYHWLRASTTEQETTEHEKVSSTALCKVLNIIAQAVRASFRDNGNDPTHLATSLEAKTIAKFVEPDPSVKSVSQPFGSFGGRMAEQGNDYYRRVSERLRHKGRGITMWDYERLVLENFPSIYKVKCISHTRDVTGNKSCYSELAPGNVCLTVVSNLRNQNEVDKLKPTTSINTRDEIQKFLKKRTSKFANITVINPDYELIQAKCNVTYLPEFEKDKGYYDNVLIEDIKKFLSPWAFDEGFDIVFGGKIHSSYIINFIEERPYVDFLTDFEMTKFKANDNGDYTISETAEELSASFAKTILVSADTHLINTNS